MTDQADPVDARLREYGERWRHDVAPLATVDVERLGSERRSGSGWWLVPAAAAAVLAVIIGAQVIDTGSWTTPRHSVAVGQEAVVPWAPLPPTHPQIPTVTIPAVPDPSAAAAAPVCQGSDLKGESEGPGGAMGTTYLNIRVTLRGNRSCRLQGFPRIQPLDHGHRLNIPIQRATDDSIYRDPVLVTKQHPALLALSWGSLWCTTPVRNDMVRAVLPSNGALTFKGFGVSPFCNGTPGSGSTPIIVKPFQPENGHPPEVRSAYTSVDVSGNLRRTAAPGGTVRFTVTLTSKRRLILDPCPDYTIGQYGPHGSHNQTFELNCADVPFKDYEGHPYLPAGRPVRFAMETTAGATGVEKFTWILNTPDRTVQLGDLLRVQTSASQPN
jgi:Protein of unknown function (DUF4232)